MGTLAFVLVLSVAAACGSDAPAEGDTLTPATTSPRDEADSAQVTSNSASSQPPTTSPSLTIEELAADDVAFEALHRALPSGRGDCDAAVAEPEVLSQWAALVEEARSTFGSQGRAFLPDLYDRALGHVCELPPGTGSAVAGDHLAELVGALDRLAVRALGFSPFTYSPLWSEDELSGLLAWTQDDQPETVVVGSSVAVSGIDPEALSEFTAGTVSNVAIGGGFPDQTLAWLETLWPERSPANLVWVWNDVEFFSLCDPGRREEAEDRRRRRDTVFGGLSEEITDPLFIRPHLDSYGESRVLDNARQRITAGSIAEQATEAELDFQASVYGSLSAGEACVDRIDRSIETVSFLSGQGSRVLVAYVPATAELSDLFPGGDSALASAAAPILERAKSAGAEIVDLTDLDATMFADLTHLNARGRVLATQSVGRALADASSADAGN